MNIKKILIGGMIFLGSTTLSHACSFIPREYSEIYEVSEKIFIGQTVPEKKMENGKFSFNVLEALKGDMLQERVEVSDPMFGTSCQKWGYESGKFWIMAINKNLEVSEMNMDKSFGTLNEAKDFFLMNFSKTDIVVIKPTIDIHFKTNALVDSIIDFKEKLINLASVDSTDIEYVSREQALEEFKIKHQNDNQILEALEVVGENPLGSYFKVDVGGVDVKQIFLLLKEFEGRPDAIIDNVNDRGYFSKYREGVDTEQEAIDFYNVNMTKEELVITENTPVLGGIKPPKPENPEEPIARPGMLAVGPTGPPNIVGPTSAPPTKAELDRIKAKAEGKGERDGLGFWGKVWDWIVGLFR